MLERRRYKRLVTEGLGIQCKMQFHTNVKLLNISSSGASISLDRRLTMGDEYSLHVECQESSILLKGVVVWKKIVGSKRNEKGEVIPIYEAGIRFNNVITEKGVEIIDFIERNLIPQRLKTRLRGVRVEITNHGKTTKSLIPKPSQLLPLLSFQQSQKRPSSLPLSLPLYKILPLARSRMALS